MLPKCSVQECRMWVMNGGEEISVNGHSFYVGPRAPLSDKCWWHAHGEEPPKDDDKPADTNRG